MKAFFTLEAQDDPTDGAFLMDQDLFNKLADDLIAEGKEVSYASMREALSEHRREAGQPKGKAASNRDLKDPYKVWRKRRGYKKHLTVLDLPESMEKLLASFTREAMILAAASAVADKEMKALKLASASLEEAQAEVADRDERLDELARENRRLRRQIETLRKSQLAGGRRSFGGTKTRGIAASTAHHFWDRVALRVAAVLRTGKKPMTIRQLVEAIDEDTKDLADAAFESITETVLAKRLRDRVLCNRYRLHKKGDVYLLEKIRKADVAGDRAA